MDRKSIKKVRQLYRALFHQLYFLKFVSVNSAACVYDLFYILAYGLLILVAVLLFELVKLV